MDYYQQYIHASRYARWIEAQGKRETWKETVDRWWQYMVNEFSLLAEREDVHQAVLDMEVMPSMRGLMTAGPALTKNHIAQYNCAFLVVDDPKAFDETLLILMHGTGVGFSVERQYITSLPEVPDTFETNGEIIVVQDSKEGWAKGYRKLVSRLFSGEIPRWDLRKIRPMGTRLKTFGGRASGPEPLDNLFRYTVNVFRKAKGRKLNSIECHDLMCQVAAAVVVGGVRRSAMISLSNLSDDRMRRAKTGTWWNENPNRSYANNSIAFTEKPDVGSFMREWLSIYESRAGERGIFNRVAAKQKAESIGRDVQDFGTNPCGEILLRSRQFCNLSEVVVRPTDTVNSLVKKVEIATIIGTVQSALVGFKGLSPAWKKNCEEERLLGVSLTGIYDNRLTRGDRGKAALTSALVRLRQHAKDTNIEYASQLGINPSAAVTCVKPSGTVSQLVNAASGIHPRYSSHYVRRVRASINDPLALWMIEQGCPHEIDTYNPQNYVFSFPLHAARGATTKDDISALAHLDLWSVYRQHWTDHNPSVTIYVDQKEWPEVGAWVYNNWTEICGIAFLPKEDDDHSYVQAPYEEITPAQYKSMAKVHPRVDFSAYRETDDNTVASQELACTAGICEI